MEKENVGQIMISLWMETTRDQLKHIQPLPIRSQHHPEPLHGSIVLPTCHRSFRHEKSRCPQLPRRAGSKNRAIMTSRNFIPLRHCLSSIHLQREDGLHFLAVSFIFDFGVKFADTRLHLFLHSNHLAKHLYYFFPVKSKTAQSSNNTNRR